MISPRDEGFDDLVRTVVEITRETPTASTEQIVTIVRGCTCWFHPPGAVEARDAAVRELTKESGR